MTFRRPSPQVHRKQREITRGSKDQLKAWEETCREAGIDKYQARKSAHEIADVANGLGMYSSDSLELAISAVRYDRRGRSFDQWLDAIRQKHFTNQANGLNLAWIAMQFEPDEIARVGRAGLRAAERDASHWIPGGGPPGSQVRGEDASTTPVGLAESPVETPEVVRRAVWADPDATAVARAAVESWSSANVELIQSAGEAWTDGPGPEGVSAWANETVHGIRRAIAAGELSDDVEAVFDELVLTGHGEAPDGMPEEWVVLVLLLRHRAALGAIRHYMREGAERERVLRRWEELLTENLDNTGGLPSLQGGETRMSPGDQPFLSSPDAGPAEGAHPAVEVGEPETVELSTRPTVLEMTAEGRAVVGVLLEPVPSEEWWSTFVMHTGSTIDKQEDVEDGRLIELELELGEVYKGLDRVDKAVGFANADASETHQRRTRQLAEVESDIGRWWSTKVRAARESRPGHPGPNRRG